ncbi:MAG: ATPase [Bacteroidaceae bacterium]|nr:ATPase [Bacteroidaceae bacterium]
MTILIADSGSTKTDWVLCNNGNVTAHVKTQGLNPTIQSTEEILSVLEAELAGEIAPDAPEKIYFYGAGCAYDLANSRMELAITSIFTTKDIYINSDLLGAARALCGHEEGIACILGTGSNSCLYNGKDIVENTPSLGYILGDEGSGAHLGRQLVSDCIKKQLPKDIREKFMQQYNLDVASILEKVYHSPLPNRWLGSLTPFIIEHRKNADIRAMVTSCFTQFFKRNVMVYRHSWLPIHIIGGIGISFSEEIKEAAESLGLSIGNIFESPIKGLINYHNNQ